MSQGVLGFKYEEEKRDTGMTGLAGLPVYLDLVHAMGFPELIGRHLQVKQRGWTDAQMVLSLMLLNLAGGDCVEDLRTLEKDEGFCRILRRMEQQGMRRAERREAERRWRKERWRSVPSSSAAFRYLSAFHDGDEEKKRKEGKAFIPAANEHLRGLAKVNHEMAAFLQRRDPRKTATLDQDATLVETAKRDALFSYQGHKSYQPLNTWWAEHEMVLHTEFREGNVPAGHEQLRVLKESLSLLPAGVTDVRLRSDTAGYQHSLLRYCEQGKDRRFGRIEFGVGADVTPEFKKAVLTEVDQKDWRPIYREYDGQRIQTNQEWAEVCLIPNVIGHRMDAPVYRYLAIREPVGSMDLPDMPQQEFPFQTLQMDLQQYKERCGKSEEAHSVMKGDFDVVMTFLNG